MNASIYNLFLTILAGITLIIPFTGKVHDGRRKWFKGFTIRGWVLFFTVLLGIIINYQKDLHTETEDLEKARSIKLEKKKDDSIANVKTIQSNTTIVNTFTTALAKYGLKYDSAQKVINKLIKDSSRLETKIIRVQPNISISGIDYLNPNSDSAKLKIVIYCKFAEARHVRMKTYFAFLNQDKLIYYNAFSNIFYMNDGLISADNALTYFVPFKNLSPSVKRIYFLLRGSYEDETGIKHDLNDLCSLEIKKNAFGVPGEPVYTEVLHFFDSKIELDSN